MPKRRSEGDLSNFKRRKNAHLNRKFLVLTTKNLKHCECISLRKFICVSSLIQIKYPFSAKLVILIQVLTYINDKKFAWSTISHFSISMHHVFICKLLTTLMLKNVLNMEFFLEQKISSYLLSHQSS